MEIQLTKKGSELFYELNNRSNDQIKKVIQKLDDNDRETLIHSIRMIKNILVFSYGL